MIPRHGDQGFSGYEYLVLAVDALPGRAADRSRFPITPSTASRPELHRAYGSRSRRRSPTLKAPQASGYFAARRGRGQGGADSRGKIVGVARGTGGVVDV